jgi:hypothetical protein
MKLNKLPLIVFCVFHFIISSCDKDDNKIQYNIRAKNTSLEAVQAAVDSSKSGDIILIPPGESTWKATLTIPNNKKITLLGSGSQATIISTTLEQPGSLISMGGSGSRITKIGFKLGNDNGSGITVNGKGWRIDHCRFENNIDKTIEGVNVRGSSTDEGHSVGVIDHCEFLNIRVLVIGESSLMANKRWSEPLGLGTNNAVFVEDCKFIFTQFGNVMDTNYGGRYVFRNNSVTDSYIEAHSLQGTSRGTRSWEIYNNTITQENRSMWAPFFLRGGTGVVFNNTFYGKWSSGPSIIVDNRRSFQALGEGGLCDGSSLWDGNEEPNGYPARDQIGRSTDKWLWTNENPYPPQEHDPFYQWGNKHNNIGILVLVHNNCGIHIKENRDYYNNIARPDYTPYTYPHPLINEWDTGN